ncbi:fimbrial protein [Serratia plymuthica]|nr:fimbrial protein [Serratia plymuthica]
MRRKASCLLIGALTVLPFMAAASSTTVNIKVTVLAPPPCVINGDKTIVVNFGSNVEISRVDGSNYLKTIDYTLECKGNTKNAMKMMIEGSGAAFDNGVLQTSKTDLGIALKQNGQPFKVYQWVNFTYPAKPVLQAVPVKRSGSTLSTGMFYTTATLKVDYQ